MSRFPFSRRSLLGLGLTMVALGAFVIVATEQEPGLWVLAAGNLGNGQQVTGIHSAIDHRSAR